MTSIVMPSVIFLSFVMLCFIMLGFVMQGFVMLGVLMLGVVILSVIFLSVEAFPEKETPVQLFFCLKRLLELELINRLTGQTHSAMAGIHTQGTPHQRGKDQYN
jgi:hypothetical protein